MTVRSHNPGVLGLTHISDGLILPFSDIDCDHVRSLIQTELMMERANERKKIFGRAIARVLAHELYHIFANTRKHGSGGSGKSRYFARELVSGDFQFEKRDCITLRKGTIIANLENAVAPKGTPPPDPSNR